MTARAVALWEVVIWELMAPVRHLRYSLIAGG